MVYIQDGLGVRQSIHVEPGAMDFSEQLAAAQALVIWHPCPDNATAQGNFSTFGHFDAFYTGLAIEDMDDLAAALRAFAGLPENCGNGVGFMFHSACFDKVIKILKTAGRMKGA